MNTMTMIVSLIVASNAADAGVFFRRNTPERRCAALLDKGTELAATPETIGGRVSLKATQDFTLAEYAELFDLGPKNDFVEKTFVPALRMSSDSDIEAMREALIDHVQNMEVTKKRREERDYSIRQLTRERFVSPQTLLRMARVQPDLTLDLMTDMTSDSHRREIYFLKQFFLPNAEPLKDYFFSRLYSVLAKWLPLSATPAQAQELVRSVQYRTIYRLLRERPSFEVFESAAKFLTQFETMSFTQGRKKLEVAATGSRARPFANSVLELGARMNGVDPAEALKKLAAFAPPVAIRIHRAGFRQQDGIEISYSQAAEDMLKSLFTNGFRVADYNAFGRFHAEMRNFEDVMGITVTPSPVVAALDEAGTRAMLAYLITFPTAFARPAGASPTGTLAQWIFDLARDKSAFHLLDAKDVEEALKKSPDVREKLEALL